MSGDKTGCRWVEGPNQHFWGGAVLSKHFQIFVSIFGFLNEGLLVKIQLVAQGRNFHCRKRFQPADKHPRAVERPWELTEHNSQKCTNELLL